MTAIERNTQEHEFIRLIPWWSMVLAAVAFVGMQVAMITIMPKDHSRPLPWVMFWAFLSGIFFAFYMLVLGYVTRDAKRRGMNPTLWVIILICLIGSGVGFIIYFLLRDPIVLECPRCHDNVDAGFNFCPNCRFELAPCCPHCQRTVHHGDVYCAFCGQTLEVQLERLSSMR